MVKDPKNERDMFADDDARDELVFQPDMLVLPPEGKLAPYTEMELQFVFQPQTPAEFTSPKGFHTTLPANAPSQQYQRVAILESAV